MSTHGARRMQRGWLVLHRQQPHKAHYGMHTNLVPLTSPPRHTCLPSHTVSLTIAKARASIPRGTPGSDGFYTLVDALFALGGSLPEIKPSPPPPPPTQRSSPPRSPPPPSPQPPKSSGTPSGGNNTGVGSGPWSFLGCYIDNVGMRALPWRLSVSDKAISIERVGNLLCVGGH